MIMVAGFITIIDLHVMETMVYLYTNLCDFLSE